MKAANSDERVLDRVGISGKAQNVPVRIRRSLWLSFTERYAAILINFIAAAVLARLLTPSDYGIYTLGIVIVGVTEVLRDFGVISFLIQEKDLTQDQVRTAYGISLLIGLALGGAIAISSGWIADFYGNAGVREVLLVLAVNFVLMPFGATVLTLLRREMNFAALLWISLISVLVSTSTAIVLAVIGFGFMSLAWGTLAGSLVKCVMAAVQRPKQFSVRPSLKDWRRITSFGVVATAGILLSEIGLRAPELLVGRLLGVAAVGFLGRADGLTTIFNRMVTTAVAPVVVSAFALQHRSGSPLKAHFLRAMALITGIAWPFYALVALMASPIIHIVFGGGWDAAIPLTRALCLASAINALANLNWLVFQAMGAIKKNLWVQLATQPIVVLLVIAAAQVNLQVVTGALIIAAAITVVVSYRFLDDLIGATLDDVVRVSMKSAGVTIGTMIVPALVVLRMQIDADHVAAPLAIAAAGATAGWLLGLQFFRHDLGKEILNLATNLSSRFS